MGNCFLGARSWNATAGRSGNDLPHDAGAGHLSMAFFRIPIECFPWKLNRPTPEVPERLVPADRLDIAISIDSETAHTFQLTPRGAFTWPTPP